MIQVPIPFEVVDRALSAYPPHCTTLSNKPVLYDPATLTDIDIFDVALGLSRIPRFLGQTREFYTVAEHSIWVSRWVANAARNQGLSTALTGELRLKALLHDAQEAFVGDLPSPLKREFDLAGYCRLEDRVAGALSISSAHGGEDKVARPPLEFDWFADELVHQGDVVAFLVESRDLRNGHDFIFLPRRKVIPVKDTDVIYQMFVDEFFQEGGLQ